MSCGSVEHNCTCILTLWAYQTVSFSLHQVLCLHSRQQVIASEHAVDLPGKPCARRMGTSCNVTDSLPLLGDE